MKKLLLLLLYIPLVSFGQRDIIEVDYVINNDKSVSFNYKKNRPGSYFLILEFNSLNNTRANTFKRVINGSSGSLTKLKPTNPDEGIGFRYSFKYYKGNLNSKINYDYPYILPFDKGKTNFANELYSLENAYLKKEKNTINQLNIIYNLKLKGSFKKANKNLEKLKLDKANLSKIENEIVQNIITNSI